MSGDKLDSEEKKFLRIEPDKISHWKKHSKIIGIVFLLVFLSYFLLGGDSGLIMHARLKFYASDLRRQIKLEQAKTDSLQLLIEKLQNDPDYLEKYARVHLGMIKPNEKVIYFKDVADISTRNKTTAKDSISKNF